MIRRLRSSPPSMASEGEVAAAAEVGVVVSDRSRAESFAPPSANSTAVLATPRRSALRRYVPST